MIFVGADANLPIEMLGVGPPVDDALGVVRRGRVVTGPELRIVGRLDVDDVQTPFAGIGRNGVGEARLLVDRQVVRMLEIAVDDIGVECPGRRQPPQARQIEHLHAVGAGVVRDDVRMVPIDLDVPPEGLLGLGRQPPEEDRILRVGDVDEGSAVVHAHQGVLLAGLRIGPAPDVVAGLSAHHVERHPAVQRDAVTTEVAGAAVRAQLGAGAERPWR